MARSRTRAEPETHSGFDEADRAFGRPQLFLFDCGQDGNCLRISSIRSVIDSAGIGAPAPRRRFSLHRRKIASTCGPSQKRAS
jgi:hypothetical protein